MEQPATLVIMIMLIFALSSIMLSVIVLIVAFGLFQIESKQIVTEYQIF